jgi:hypothetical protein
MAGDPDGVLQLIAGVRQPICRVEAANLRFESGNPRPPNCNALARTAGRSAFICFVLFVVLLFDYFVIHSFTFPIRPESLRGGRFNNTGPYKHRGVSRINT